MSRDDEVKEIPIDLRYWYDEFRKKRGLPPLEDSPKEPSGEVTKQDVDNFVSRMKRAQRSHVC